MESISCTLVHPSSDLFALLLLLAVESWHQVEEGQIPRLSPVSRLFSLVLRLQSRISLELRLLNPLPTLSVSVCYWDHLIWYWDPLNWCWVSSFQRQSGTKALTLWLS